MKSKRSPKTPWNAGPACTTRRAILRWDWKGNQEILDKINKNRAAKGLPPIERKA